MRKLYYNTEQRIPSQSVISQVKGKAGKRVLCEDTGIFYYWNNSLSEWVLESVGYDYYRCQLFQNGSSGAPYDNVLGSHSLSDFITWEKLDTGLYRGTLEGAFPEFKTQFIHSGTSFNHSVLSSPVSSPPGEFISSLNHVHIERLDNDTIFIHVFDDSFNRIDGLRSYDLEIRVYNENSLRD